MDALVREHDVRAIVIYDSWFEDQRDGVPGSWVPVEEWCLEGGTIRIVGGRCVTWYGPTADDAAELHRRLDDGRSLPGGTSYRRLDGGPRRSDTRARERQGVLLANYRIGSGR